MILNLANYKVGKKYAFGIGGVVYVCEILGKGHKKLQVKFADNRIEWVETMDLNRAELPKTKAVASKPIDHSNFNPFVNRPLKNPPNVQISLDKIKESKIREAQKRVEEATSSFTKELKLDVESQLEDENVTDYTYLIRSVKRDLRDIAHKKGYKVSKDTRFSELLKIFQINLKEAR